MIIDCAFCKNITYDALGNGYCTKNNFNNPIITDHGCIRKASVCKDYEEGKENGDLWPVVVDVNKTRE